MHQMKCAQTLSIPIAFDEQTERVKMDATANFVCICICIHFPLPFQKAKGVDDLMRRKNRCVDGRISYLPSGGFSFLFFPILPCFQLKIAAFGRWNGMVCHFKCSRWLYSIMNIYWVIAVVSLYRIFERASAKEVCFSKDYQTADRFRSFTFWFMWMCNY